jgi:hypothetical protein
MDSPKQQSNFFQFIKRTYSSILFAETVHTLTKQKNNLAISSIRFEKSMKKRASDVLFLVGNKFQNTSETLGYAIIAFGYRFIDEPTKIFDVQTIVLSPTSVKISWKTNQPANEKVNYGPDKTYGFDIQTDKRQTYHEFVLNKLLPDTTYYFEVMNHAKTYVYDANREFHTDK